MTYDRQHLRPEDISKWSGCRGDRHPSSVCSFLSSQLRWPNDHLDQFMIPKPRPDS